MAFTQNRHLPTQGGYQNHRSTSSSYERSGAPTRNYSNIVDLTSHGPDIDTLPAMKRRKSMATETSMATKNSFSSSLWENQGRCYQPFYFNDNSVAACRSDLNLFNNLSTSNHQYYNYSQQSYLRDCTGVNEDGVSPNSVYEASEFFMSRDEIERCSPSRKDGIDLRKETHLRYSYCAFLQNLGMTLELPQTTIATAIVLCHRFFVRRSHAYHDRFLVATASLFLAAKSEETPRPLNSVIRASCEICHKHDLAFFPHLLPVDWFEKYRERVIEAEQMILTTLDFELTVQHPYIPLTTVLSKLGLSQSVLVNLAWNLVNEGLRSSLWLQFKPHHIAAGAVFLAAKFLNLDLVSNQSVWQEFQTTPSIIQDVSQQLMELF
ncbi:hypothetical protein AMTRI_Chr01g135900 [Amborella trichopoda]